MQSLYDFGRHISLLVKDKKYNGNNLTEFCLTLNCIGIYLLQVKAQIQSAISRISQLCIHSNLQLCFASLCHTILTNELLCWH